MKNKTLLTVPAFSLKALLKAMWYQVKHIFPILKSPSVMFLLIFTSIIGGVFFIIQPIIYTNDTGGYLEAAKFFSHTPGGKYQYWRTPLFPMLLALTGAARESSIHGIVVLHFILALSMPLLIYFSVYWVNKRVALFSALIVSISLLPFLNVSYIMPNQLFVFFMVAAVCFTWRFIGLQKTIDIYTASLFAFMAIMARPQGSYIFVVLLAVMFAVAPKKWRHCALALAIVVGLQYSYMLSRPYFAGPIAPSSLILLPNPQKTEALDDKELYMRSLSMVRQNGLEDARFVARFIHNKFLSQKVYLAIILQSLLNKDLNFARKQALAASDPVVRDQALFFVAWATMAEGDAIKANILRDEIGDDELRKKFNMVSANTPEIPVLTSVVPAKGSSGSSHFVSGLDLTNTSGKMLLYSALLARNDINNQVFITPDNGPATKQLYRILNLYFSSEGVLKVLYPSLAASVKDPNQAARVLMTETPYHDAHWTLWGIMDRIYGPAEGDLFLKKVFLEFAKEHPMTLIRLYWNSVLKAFVGYNTITNIHKEVLAFNSSNINFPSHPDVVTIPALKHEIITSQKYQAMYFFVNTYYSKVFPIFLMTIVFLASLGILFIRELRLFLVWMTCWLVTLHQVAVCAITSGALFAYVSFVYIFLIVAAVLSVYAGYKFFCKSSADSYGKLGF